jgi:hypothetical protein
MDLFYSLGAPAHGRGGVGGECCDQPIEECTDEQCLKLLDEYCQLCQDQQPCEAEGCTLHCEECCNDINCVDGQCSLEHSQVHLFLHDENLSQGDVFTDFRGIFFVVVRTDAVGYSVYLCF